MGTLASTSLDHDRGFKINRFLNTRDRQIEYCVSEAIRLPRKFKCRFRHTQVMQDKTLIAMVVRWNNHQALFQVLNWARVFITKMLVDQVGCSLYAFPIDGPVIKQVERCNHRFKVRRSLIHVCLSSSLSVSPIAVLASASVVAPTD